MLGNVCGLFMMLHVSVSSLHVAYTVSMVSTSALPNAVPSSPAAVALENTYWSWYSCRGAVSSWGNRHGMVHNLQEDSGAMLIQKQGVDFLDIFNINLTPLSKQRLHTI